MSPTARTMAALRARGYKAYKVEQTVPHTFIKRDVGGFGDVLAWGREGIMLIQATTGDHLAHRILKIRGECREAAQAWIDAGGIIEVWGWRALKVRRGGRQVRWSADVRRIEILEG